MYKNEEIETKILICIQCGEEFVFTVSAQGYFTERGFTEDPKRCKHCHQAYKRKKGNNIGNLPLDNRPGV